MATEVSVDLQEILLASEQLGGMADVYGEAVSKLQSAQDAGNTWEKPESAAAWSDFLNAVWDVCADSQDNLNAASRTMVRYINAVCETDGSNRDKLTSSVEDYNKAVRSSLDTNEDGKVSESEQEKMPDLRELPTPNDDSSGDAVDEPDFDDAERPEGD